jgi:ribonuclease HII
MVRLMQPQYRIGADENGLGAQLGPLIVTAVLAQVSDPRAEMLWRRLPKRVAADLNDSKRLLAHGSVALGEAWTRILTGDKFETPAELLRTLSLETTQQLEAPCPTAARDQCWHTRCDQFQAEAALLSRVQAHVQQLQQRGLQIVAVKTSITCTKRLNDAKGDGHNRFVADLHAMERLILQLREQAGLDVHAVCGKVGGIGDYSRYFGPLSHRLHAVLQVERKHSAYRFPGLGEVHFVQDADAKDPLVMMASMVGKYVRELLMTRIAAHYELQDEEGKPLLVSGYNDPRTDGFVQLTRMKRREWGVPKDCFQRAPAESPAANGKIAGRAAARTATKTVQ